MGQNVCNHVFNTDLLLRPGDRTLASAAYPRLVHVLDHPELRDLFERYDVPANRARRRSRLAGLVAILLGTLALLDASVASFLGSSAWYLTALGILAAIAGIASVMIGWWGVLHGQAKWQWLTARLMTERLRQFHFQTFVCHFSAIVESLATSNGVDDYLRAHAQRFAKFNIELNQGNLDAKLEPILNGVNPADAWLDAPLDGPPEPAGAVCQATNLDDVFNAYRDLRLMHQLSYADYKLRDQGSLWSASPRKLLGLLSQATLVVILLLLAIHAVIAFGLALPPLQLAYIVESPWVHIAAIWCAILALAIRGVEEGLGVRKEFARYRDYRSAVEAILQRFDRRTIPLGGGAL